MTASEARSFRRDTAWCWAVEPSLPAPTTTHHEVIVDGVWIGSWCLLIATTKNLDVLAWQWCARESAPAWAALLQRIPAPGIIVCDGGTGLASAVRAEWPETRIQRCVFHVQMNVRRHLTLKPKTTAGKRLLALSRMLSAVWDEAAAIEWQKHLDAWWREHGYLTKERTRYANGQLGFTHDRLRKAWNLLQHLTRTNVLFTFITYGNPRTTSALEGGINSQLRTVLRNHRGMPEHHMKRAAEWFLTLHETPISQAHQFITSDPLITSEPVTQSEEEQEIRASLYDTSLSAEEGLWSRSGWAGRG